MGDHVQGVKDVVAPDEHRQPDIVEQGRGKGGAEDQQGAQGEGDGVPPQKGDAPPVPVAGLVAEGGHHGVGHRVDDMPQRFDEADHGQNPSEHIALGDEDGQAGGGGGLVEIDQVVVQHGGEQPHGEQGQAV